MRSRKEVRHGNFVVLVNFTDQGARNIKDTTKRPDVVRELAKKFGVTAEEFYWTFGNYDVVDLFDAPDEAPMAAFLSSYVAMGNVRTTTLRGFTQAEVNQILAKAG